MIIDIGEQIVLWTARGVVLAYLVRLHFDLADWRKRAFVSEKVALSCWMLGAVLFYLHVWAAFHFVHHYSHSAALLHTARQTAAVTGWEWGGGLWINYAMMVWWPLDLWASFKWRLSGLPNTYRIGLHIVFGFLLFNATVVFGHRWWTSAFGIWLASLLLWLNCRCFAAAEPRP